ncbi:MAG: T9SS type A sorting domain-containing protein, partial [Bacteroidia bacterium]
VLKLSVSASSVSASVNPVKCPGGATTLSLSGGFLGSGANWEWFKDSCDGKLIGTTGNKLIIYPSATYLYYVRAKGICNSTPCVSATIIVTNSNSNDPSGIHSSNNSLCYGQTSALSVLGGSLGTGAVWKWYTGLYCTDSFIGQGATITIKPSDTAIYFVKAEGTCNITNCAVDTILVNKLPRPNAGNDTFVCLWSSVELKANAPGCKFYNWSPTIGLDNPNLLNPKASPITVTHYILSATDTNNCTNTDTLEIIVNQLPRVDAGYDTAICKGGFAQLNTSRGGATYKWMPGNELNDTNISNPKASPKLTTKYSVTLTDSNGCSNSDEVRITVNPLPNANAGKDVAICQGEIAQLKASGGISYIWDDTLEIDIPNISNPKAKPLNTKTFKVRVGNIYGCSAIDSLKIIVNPLPLANAGIDDSICIGQSTILDAEGGILFVWNPSKGLDKFDESKVTARPEISTIYSVMVTDFNGCSKSDEVYITVNLLPLVKVNVDTSICAGTAYQLKTAGNFKNFDWKENNSTFSLIKNPVVNPVKTSTTYTLKATDFNNCQNSDSVIVTVVQDPSPKISSSDSIVCKNQYWAEYCTVQSSNNFNWSVENGNILTGQGTNCIKVHWSDVATSGKVLVTEKLKSLPQCSSSNIFEIKMKDGKAPLQAKIIAKANSINSNILICQFCNYKIYIWGYEPKTQQPSEVINCEGTTWCNFFFIDTLKYNYWVKVGNDSGCLTKSYFNAPRLTNPIENNLVKNKILIYPNPTEGIIHIESIYSIDQIKIFTPLGTSKFISIPEGNDNHYELDLSALAKGIYFINFKTQKGITSYKLIRQ